MKSVALWFTVGGFGTICMVLLVRALDKLLLRAEAKGWIYYRKTRAGGTLSCGIAAGMRELDRLVRPSVEHVIQVEHSVVPEHRQATNNGAAL